MGMIKIKRYKNLINNIAKYYTKKIEQYGASHKGVDWNSTKSQELRFTQLLKICESDKKFLINDLGCGYGYLAYFMIKKVYNFDNLGIEISKK